MSRNIVSTVPVIIYKHIITYINRQIKIYKTDIDNYTLLMNIKTFRVKQKTHYPA